MVGSLMYLTNHRQTLYLHVCMCAEDIRQMPTKKHFEAIKRVLSIGYWSIKEAKNTAISTTKAEYIRQLSGKFVAPNPLDAITAQRLQI
ncbi:hypothetical protein Tco_0865746 [Tanacetum coccineum]